MKLNILRRFNNPRTTDDEPPFTHGDLVTTRYLPEALGVVYRVTRCRPAEHFASGWALDLEATAPPDHNHAYFNQIIGLDSGHLSRHTGGASA